ncbi:acyl--CoA ligase [Oscillochloris sp. ZM17-4]|uniref:acyl--CoA ligase n=1 Tax=Oscillochloris sp. ZM17-4 TaxID=2866714 RepID=UPI001C73D714|nr:acyl--CoA ligase [Oscillochloris sp. ZM17-4]MBX0327671.1 acyl--CoA ligase [Oscillochloris sp. ZM17-4]
MSREPVISTLLDMIGGGAPDRPALVAPGRPDLSYAALRANVAELAGQLQGIGVGPGDRVAIAMGNGPEMVIAFLAAATAATAAPLNPKYRADEFAFYYEDTQAKALIMLPGSIEAARAAMLPDMQLVEATNNEDGTLSFGIQHSAFNIQHSATPDDVAMILHTSGTTSRPKRVPIRHRNLATSAANIIETYQLGPEDRALCVMPLFHIHGIVASMLSTLASGGTLICPPGFDAMRFWGWVEQYKPTWYSAVPTMHQLLLARAERNLDVIKANPFRFIRSSSAPLPPVVMERLEATFGAPVLESYGMTEASHQMASNPLPPAPRKSGSVGVGVGVDVGIMDDAGRLLPRGARGEVVVRGGNVVDGYENNPQANAAAFTDGWFRTGDQGYLDEDGYLALTGRLKELINRGGEKISPLEIDDVLLRHPAVAEALAFAVPHKTLGEDVHAAVVLKAEASEKDLREHCARSLADFKVPRQIHILEALPRGATGKLQRITMAKTLGIDA